MRRRAGQARTDAEEFAAAALLLDDAEALVPTAERFLYVRGKSGKVVPLRANRAQRAYEERRGRENIVLKARQMGLSTWISGRFLLKTMLVPGTVTVQVAHTREAAEGLFRIVQRMWENLPADVRAGYGRRARANVSEMSFPDMDSEFRVVSAAEPNAGRGLTITNLHCSEVSRWPGDAAETLAGLRAALAPEGELVLESTPNGAYGCFYREWTTTEDCGVVRHFFPWWWEPTYVAHEATELTAEESELTAREGLTPGQIGFRRQLASRFGAMRSQEFAEDPVTCFRQSGSCIFDTEALAGRTATLSGPVRSRWNGTLQIWLPPVHGRDYLVAVDPAGGGEEGDFAAVQVIDRATGMQCAELRAKLTPRMLAERVTDIARDYGGALVVVERNNHGAAVLAYLEGADGLRVYHSSDRAAGWLTTAVSRERALARLGVLLATEPHLFQSVRLLEECRSFVLKSGGRTEAATGAHDDLVMAMAIAHAVRDEVRTVARHQDFLAMSR